MHHIIKKFSGKNWLMVLGIFVLTFGQVFFTMEIVGHIGALTAAIQSKDTEMVWFYGLAMVICALLMMAVQSGTTFLASSVASDVVSRIRGTLYAKVNKLALSDLTAFSTESLVTRTTNDLQNIHLALLTALRTVFVAPITAVWSVILLVQFASGPLTVASLIWLFVMVAATVILLILVTPKYRIVQKLTDALNVASRENLTGVRVVRAFNAEKYQEAKFTKVNTEYTKAQIFTGRAISLFTPIVMMVMTGLTLSIIWISAYLLNGVPFADAPVQFASINPFVMLATQIVMSFVLLVTLIVLWPRANVCARRINEVLTHKETVLDPENPEEFTEKGTIEFRNVGFAYPGGGGEAVSDITFKVNRGETLALIGATGSGKTTIVNMIPRMADATRGEVLVDGVDVRNVRQADLRKIIGYTPQRAFLFKGNIRENIAFGDPSMTLTQVKKASAIAEADGFVSAKREGYDSLVAQGGTNFSGGQKQRLCIARTVAGTPEIMIFDDSFSALDYKTDKLVRGNIAREMPEATRVIIAQRVGTIMDADQILVLDHGKIVGQGKHAELIHTCPVYQEIALSQMTKEELGL